MNYYYARLFRRIKLCTVLNSYRLSSVYRTSNDKLANTKLNPTVNSGTFAFVHSNINLWQFYLTQSLWTRLPYWCGAYCLVSKSLRDRQHFDQLIQISQPAELKITVTVSNQRLTCSIYLCSN